jgi:hypothetical protein
VGLPNQGDQFAKLQRRVEALRQTLASSGWPGIQILPVVVSALPDSEIKNPKKMAQDLGIVVACRDDIVRALTEMKYPIDADRLFRAVAEGLHTQRIF